MAIAVTHAAIVATASAPASHSRRVPGAREPFGDQPLSHGSSCGGRDFLNGMRDSSGGAQTTAAAVVARYVNGETVVDPVAREEPFQ
jgi:hypothetical protein